MKSKKEYLERLNRIGKTYRSGERGGLELVNVSMPTGTQEIIEHLAILIEIMLDIRDGIGVSKESKVFLDDGTGNVTSIPVSTRTTE